MNIFRLPDLGEGLPDAEIVQWYVAEGDDITLDDPLVSMETAKAVVEVPSPYSGRVIKLYGQPGDVINTGDPLAEFEGSSSREQAGGGQVDQDKAGEDTGTVVGKMEISDDLMVEKPLNVAGMRVTPAVRALARKLRIDLATVTPTGTDGVITRADVESAGQNASRPAAVHARGHRQYGGQHEAPSTQAAGEWEPVRGTRRAMARIMSESHAAVVPTTVMDDADLHQWEQGQDVMTRLIRGMAAGARTEPGLNAWYDPQRNARKIHQGMDVGMAVDTPDGLFVAALRAVDCGSAAEIQEKIARVREQVEKRSIPPEELSGYTIMLSNIGALGGRYATPIIVPPCVCIVAAGSIRNEAVSVRGTMVFHRILPLSMTFDHRVCTGGEAARFLGAMIDDLAQAQ